VTSTVTARVAIYSVVTIIGLVGGLGLGRPELIAVAAAPLVLLAFGVGRDHEPVLVVDLALARDRALEDEHVDVFVTISARRTISRLEVHLAVPDGLELRNAADEGRGRSVPVEQGSVAVRVDGGEPTRLRLGLVCRHWGGYRLGPLHVGSEERLGVHRYKETIDTELTVKVFPPEHALRELLDPARTQINLGELVSRRSGDGIEFAELRPFGAGDDPRRINWRASSRRGALWVNQRHPERNSDVVLLIDALMGGRREAVRALDYAVRASASIASSHLGRRDRVGLLMMGGRLVWLRPRMFDLQRYKILEALTDSRLRPPSLTGSVAVPRRTLPPHALLIALSPLIDDAVVAALIDLVGRGHDMAIVEIDPASFLAPPVGPVPELARRIWSLQREGVRKRFRARGVAVAEWDPRDPFETTLREVSAFRRALRRAPV
jgi:uncharacterized protein (DUF58 family)